MRHKPKSIEDIGLDKYLNETKQSHGGWDFKDFKRMHESGLNVSNIARAFLVDRRTINKWITIYEKELADE